MPNTLQINGALPWQSFAQNQGNPYQPDLASLGAQYQKAAQSAAEFSGAQYDVINKGYGSVLDYQQKAQAGIAQGYDDTRTRVLAGLQNAGQTQRQAIADSYAQQTGAAAQNLQSRGLTNSTVTDAVGRGLWYDRQKAENMLAEQVAQQRAGYDSQLSLAGLGYQGQALRDTTALGGQQLGFMERVNVGYPNANAYGQIAAQIGQKEQADKDRAAAAAAAAQAMRPQPTGTEILPAQHGAIPPTVDPWVGIPQQAYSGAGSVQQPPRFGPPPGVTLDARPGAFTMGPYGGAIGEMSGGQVSPYGASALGGVAGMAGLTSQYESPYAYGGEGEQGLGALGGGAAGYGQYLPPSPPQNAFGGILGGMGAGYDAASQSADFYFGGEE